MWLLPFVFFLIKNTKDILCRGCTYIYVSYLIFLFYCFCAQTITAVKYIGPDQYNMAISIFILSVSYTYWKNYGNMKDLRIIGIFIILSTLYVGYFVYNNSGLMTAIDERTYAYGNKNSLSTILLAAAICGFLYYKPQKKVFLILGYMIEVVLVLIMLLLKSRATIAGFLFVILYFCLACEDKKLRSLLTIGVVVCVISIFTVPEYYDTVINNILLSNRDMGNLDEISSNRFSLFQQYWCVAKDSLVFGIGSLYFDCMPIAFLMQYGILGCCMVICMLYKMSKQLYINDKTNNIHLCAYLLFIVFMVNSLFEAQPPFGPGVKCFMFWMCLGFSYAENEKIKCNTAVV